MAGCPLITGLTACAALGAPLLEQAHYQEDERGEDGDRYDEPEQVPDETGEEAEHPADEVERPAHQPEQTRPYEQCNQAEDQKLDDFLD